MVLLSLLMSGSVFAYSTHFSQLSSSASPLLANDKSSTTTSAGSTVSTEHENTQVSNTHTSENDGEHTLQFKLVPATTAAVGKGDAELQIRGTDVRVHIEVEQAVKTATYKVTMVVSDTPTFTVSSAFCTGSLGTFMTSDEGQDEVKMSATVSTGTHFLGLVLCTAGTPALISDPLTRQATITTATTTSSETEQTDQTDQV